MTSSSFAGSCGFRRTGDTGSRFRMASKIIAEVSPWNGTLPVAISYKTAPNENRSVRRSSSFPFACSGDMYATVPTAVPGLVRNCRSGPAVAAVIPSAAVSGEAFTLASPKSRTLACPRLVTKMFAGLMSRCTIPSACAASSASAISIDSGKMLSSSIARPAIRCFSVIPSRNSMAMNAWPSCSPMS